MSLVFRYVYWIQIKFLLLTYERRQSRRPYWKKQSLKHHIWSKIRVVGYPKNDKIPSGRLLFWPWCSDMFIGYKTAFFSKHMNDSKAGGPIEKSNFWGIIFSLKLGLWVTQKMINSGVSACFAVAGVQICLLDTKKLSSPNIWTTAKQAAISKKTIFEASYLI